MLGKSTFIFNKISLLSQTPFINDVRIVHGSHLIMSQEKQLPLKDRLKRVQENFTTSGPVIEDFSFEEVVERVEKFLIHTDKLKIAFSFGNKAETDSDTDGNVGFDPIKRFQDYPDELETLSMYVGHELDNAEKDLIEMSNSNLCDYNTLVFGTALKLANGEKLSEPLNEFIVEHLINPNQSQKAKVGRPPKTKQDDLFKYMAIKFAVKHNLKPSRNELGPKTSACDAVEQAAMKLQIFGYGYETLKKVWMNRKVFQTAI